MMILLCDGFENHGSKSPLPAGLRVKWFYATEESMMLFHVLSFSPPTSRPYPLLSVWVVVLDLRLLVSALLPRGPWMQEDLEKS